MRRVAPLLLAATLTLPLLAEQCELEQAVVAAVPPATFQVLVTRRCGGITCWERWIEVEGKRLGYSRVCAEGMDSQLRESGDGRRP